MVGCKKGTILRYLSKYELKIRTCLQGIRLAKSQLIQYHFCIDCGNILKDSRSKRCRKCQDKYRIFLIKGKNNPFYGKLHTKETKQKISLGHGGTGIPYENSEYPPKWTEKFKNKIRKRDNHQCQICGKKQKLNIEKLHVHHIDYNKDDLNPANLISLCRSCHMKTNGDREIFKEYFGILLTAINNAN